MTGGVYQVVITAPGGDKLVRLVHEAEVGQAIAAQQFDDPFARAAYLAAISINAVRGRS